MNAGVAPGSKYCNRTATRSAQELLHLAFWAFSDHDSGCTSLLSESAGEAADQLASLARCSTSTSPRSGRRPLRLWLRGPRTSRFETVYVPAICPPKDLWSARVRESGRRPPLMGGPRPS